MNNFESLCKNYQFTIQFLIAVGTCAAVIVALWLSRKQKPKLRVFVDKQPFVPPEAQQTGVVDWSRCKEVIGVTIRNVGEVIVYISYFSFYWRLPFPFSKKMAMQNPLPDFRQEGSLRLDPGMAKSLMFTSELVDFYNKVVLGLCEKNKVPFFMRRLVRRFLTLCVVTDLGTRIKAKTGEKLKELFLKEAAK